MKKQKNLIFIIFIFLPLLASWFSFSIRADLFLSIIFFLIIPSTVLSFVQKQSIIKSLIFSLISVPSLLVIDYIGFQSGQWVVPDTIFPFKIFKIVPIEDSLWAFFISYEIVMFYEYFLDAQKKGEYLKKKFIPLLFIAYFIPFLWFLFGFKFPALFKIKYFYILWGSVLLLIPLLLFLFKYPKLIGKFFIVGVYFFYLNFAYELSALALNWWHFPRTGDFLGWINVGQLFFPFEEFFFYVMLFSIGWLVWYEYFDDDRK